MVRHDLLFQLVLGGAIPQDSSKAQDGSLIVQPRLATDAHESLLTLEIQKGCFLIPHAFPRHIEQACYRSPVFDVCIVPDRLAKKRAGRTPEEFFGLGVHQGESARWIEREDHIR